LTETHQIGHASTLGDHVRVVRRRKWIVIATTAIVTALSVFLSVQKQTVYHAQAQVLINQVSPAQAILGTLPRIDPIRASLTESLIATGPEVAKRVAARPEFAGPGAAALRGGISVTPSETSDLLTFEATNADPAYAVMLVNAYAKEYLTYRRQTTTASIGQLRNKIQGKLDELQRDGRGGSALYATYAEQQQSLEIAETLQSATASLPRQAYGAVADGPKPIRDAILGFVLLDVRHRAGLPVERARYADTWCERGHRASRLAAARTGS